MEEEPKEVEEPVKKTPEGNVPILFCYYLLIDELYLRILFFSEVFRKVLIKTIVRWAEETQIETPKLVQEMFKYVFQQLLMLFISKFVDVLQPPCTSV
jgi:ryanodine receptor 2